MIGLITDEIRQEALKNRGLSLILELRACVLKVPQREHRRFPETARSIESLESTPSRKLQKVLLALPRKQVKRPVAFAVVLQVCGGT